MSPTTTQPVPDKFTRSQRPRPRTPPKPDRTLPERRKPVPERPGSR